MIASRNSAPLVIATKAHIAAIFKYLKTEAFTLWAEIHFFQRVLYKFEGKPQFIQAVYEFEGSIGEIVEFV